MAIPVGGGRLPGRHRRHGGFRTEWQHGRVAPPRRTADAESSGRCEVRGRLGAGGMGTVYRAHDPQLGRDVAIKIPRFQGPPAARAAAQARFEREARAAASVRQAHICPIYDVGTSDGVPYVVMAFVEGQSLAELVAAGQVEPRRAAELVRQVAEGLEAVHGHGVIHRDLKPANILLDTAGKALLTDFGLARSVSDSDRITIEGSVLGTPAYMPPEQAGMSGDEVGPTADVYSLGAVLYELLTGQPPYRGNPMKIIYQIALEAPPSLSQHCLGLDPALEAIVLKAMARRPEHAMRALAPLRTHCRTGWPERSPRRYRRHLFRPPHSRPRLSGRCLPPSWPSQRRTVDACQARW